MEELQNEEGSLNTVADPLVSYRLNEIVESFAGTDAVDTFIGP